MNSGRDCALLKTFVDLDRNGWIPTLLMQNGAQILVRHQILPVAGGEKSTPSIAIL